MTLTFTVGLPQALYLGIVLIAVVLSIVKHGEAKGEWHAGWAIFAALIEVGLLYWGGFFHG